MSFILEFSVEANVGYYIRSMSGYSEPNLVKVINHYQTDSIEDMRRVIGRTYGDIKIVDMKGETERKYTKMLESCQQEVISAGQSGVKRFTVAKADENIAIEIKYYEEAVQC